MTVPSIESHRQALAAALARAEGPHTADDPERAAVRRLMNTVLATREIKPRVEWFTYGWAGVPAGVNVALREELKLTVRDGEIIETWTPEWIHVSGRPPEGGFDREIEQIYVKQARRALP